MSGECWQTIRWVIGCAFAAWLCLMCVTCTMDMTKIIEQSYVALAKDCFARGGSYVKEVCVFGSNGGN